MVFPWCTNGVPKECGESWVSNLFKRLSVGLKRPLAMAAAVVALMGGAVVTAAPASAAVYYCTTKAPYEHRPVTTSGTLSYSCYLNPSHDNATATTALQRSYNTCYASANRPLPSGRTTLIVDGDYGNETLAAIEWVQRAHGLGDDGLYGPNTARAMRMQQQAGNLPGWPVGSCHSWTP